MAFCNLFMGRPSYVLTAKSFHFLVNVLISFNSYNKLSNIIGCPIEPPLHGHWRGGSMGSTESLKLWAYWKPYV